MTRPVNVKRSVSLSSGCIDERLRDTIMELQAFTGVNKVAYDSGKVKVTIEYDLMKTSYSKLLCSLSEMGIEYNKSVRSRLLHHWYDYLDTNIRENKLAPEPACCNRPPK